MSKETKLTKLIEINHLKPLVIKKYISTEDEYIITQEKGDKDNYALSLTYNGLDKPIRLTILKGGDTDGGSIPNIAKGIFDPLLDKTAFGFIFHDELWRHRVYYKDLYKELGITFTETNKIMKEIHKEAKCSWFEQNLTRVAVRYGGWYKWYNPEDRIKEVNKPTLLIEVLNK